MPSAVAPHRVLLLLLAACLPLSLASHAFAANPTTASADPSSDIEALIAQLSSDDWPRRQDAEEQLVRFGADAVARLREVAESAADAEVRTRCESALHRIARNERVGATLVTLHLAGAAPRDALEALARQSGAALRPYPPTLFDVAPAATAGRVTLDVEREPFWEAARRLTAATGLELRPWNDELRVTAPRGGDGRQRAPSAVSGPLLIVANSVNRTANIDLATGAAVNDFSISFMIVPEPKLRVLRSWPSVRIEEAVDENGTSLAPAQPRPDSPHGTPRQAAWPATARLTYPSGAGKRIARLRGSVTFVAQTQSQTIEIRDLLAARDVRRDVGGGSVTIQSCRQVGNQYELALVLSRGRVADALPWDQFQQSALPGLRVFDADGRPLQRGQPSRSGSNDRLELTVRLVAEPAQPPQPRPGPPARLVWEIPTESREITAPFEFTDLPLP